MATGQRAFDHHVVGQAVQAAVLLQEQLQRAQRGHDDPELGVAETRVVFDQCERAQVQAGGQRDAVDAGVQRRGHAHLQRFLRAVHRQLFHAVDEHHARAFLAGHGAFHVHARGLGQVAQVELDGRLVFRVDVVLVHRLLGLDVLGLVAAVRDRLDHSVGDVAHATQAGGLQRQVGGRDIHAHAADHDGHHFLAAHLQAEIFQSSHSQLSNVRPKLTRSMTLFFSRICQI
ncbi:hypothetical protein D9M68_705800 [compost metagenome]